MSSVDLRLLLVRILRPWLWFSAELSLESMHPNPIVQFARWYRIARHMIWLEFPDAVCFATADQSGTPDSRMVLLRDFDMRGFTIFTNYNSVKAIQGLGNNQASLTFFWDALQRQIRIQGRLEKTSSQESDAYFQSRSRNSQIGAWASNQSEVLANRNELTQRFDEFSSQFNGIEVPRPPHWGGLRIIPQKIEFWKARPHRLHDRFEYSLCPDGTWKIRQLYP